MNKLVDKILEEWSYRVHDGMPDINNPVHIIELQEALNEFTIPRKAKQLLLKNLRKISEADADVVGKTIAQAKDKAKKGQTYSSEKSKKVYKKGEEGGEEEKTETGKIKL